MKFKVKPKEEILALPYHMENTDGSISIAGRKEFITSSMLAVNEDEIEVEEYESINAIYGYDYIEKTNRCGWLKEWLQPNDELIEF